MKVFYMAVTPDEYELPMYITDSAADMAAKLGITKNNVFSYISNKCTGKKSGYKIIKIVMEDSEE